MRLFRIPDRLEDLRNEEAYGETYIVEDVVNVNELRNALKAAEQCLRREGCDFIVEHFDTYYACLVNFQSLTPEVRGVAWKHLKVATSKMNTELDTFFEQFHINNREHVQRKLTMVCYLMVTYAELYLDCVTKKKDAENDITADQVMSELIDISTAFAGILANRLSSLFEPYHYLKTFMSLIMRFCYKVLEKIFINPSSISKYYNLFDITSDIIGISIDKYENANRTSSRMIEFFQVNEAYAIPMAALVANNVKRSGSAALIMETIQQIKKYQVSELTRDSSCPRAIGNFLVEVCQRETRQMFKCVHEVIDLLGTDLHYLFRNAALEVIALIIKKLFKSPKTKRDQMIKEMLLEKLAQHLYDISSYTRNKCLQMWTELANEKAIPSDYILTIVMEAIERLEDKSALVRKSAISFLVATLNHNQFVVIYQSDIAYLKDIYSKGAQQRRDNLREIAQQQGRQVDEMNITLDATMVDDEDDDDEDEEKENQQRDDQSPRGKRKGKQATPKAAPPKKRVKLLHISHQHKMLASTWFDIEKQMSVWWVKHGREMNISGDEDKLPAGVDLSNKSTAFNHFYQLCARHEFGHALNVMLILQLKYPNEPCFALFDSLMSKITENNNLQDANDAEEDDDEANDGNRTKAKTRRSFGKENDLEIEDDQEEHFAILDYIDNLFLSRILKDEIEFEHLERQLPLLLSKAKIVFLFPILQFAFSESENLEVEEKERQAIEKADGLEERMNKISNEMSESNLNAEREESYLRKFLKVINLLEQVETYRKLMCKAMPRISELMMSKNSSDVLEAIAFFRHAHKMRFTSSQESIRRMLKLVNSKEKPIKDALIESFEHIFLRLKDVVELHEKSLDEKSIATQEMRNICRLIACLDLGEKLCAHSLISELYQRQKLSKHHLTFIWQAIARKRSDLDEEEILAALKVIGMISSSDPNFVHNDSSLAIFVQNTYQTEVNRNNVRFVTESLEAFNESFRLPSTEVKDNGTAERFFKLPQSHALFRLAADYLVERVTLDPRDPYWCRLCSSTYALIYNFSEQPDKLGVQIVQKSLSQLKKLGAVSMDEQPSSSRSAETLLVDDIFNARFIHMIGELAMNVLIFLELQVRVELTIRKNIAEKRRNEKRVQKKLVTNNKKAKTSKKRASVMQQDTMVDEDDEDDEEYDGAARWERKLSELDETIKKEVLFSSSSIISQFLPIIQNLAFSGQSQSTRLVQQHSIIAMTRLMFFSPKYSRKNTPELLKVFEDDDSTVRQNMIVCMADVVQASPNCFDKECTSKMFNCLRDADDRVRMTALRIISRLILSAMIRPNLVNIVRLITDHNAAIAEAAKSFFIELSKSNNAKLFHDAYNSFVSHCHAGVDANHDEAGPMAELDFQATAKFLFEIDPKPGAFDFLVPQITNQIKATNNLQAWRELSFCLTLITCNETGFKALGENVFGFERALRDDVVHKNILEAISNYRKNKADSKGRGGSLEERIKLARQRLTEENVTTQNA